MTDRTPYALGWDAAHHIPASFGTPTPKRRGPGPGSFLLVLVLALAATVAGLQALLPVTLTLPEPTASGTTSSRPTNGTAQPRPSPATGTEQGNRDLLTDNPLYDLSPSGECPSVTQPSNRSAYEKQVAALLTCLADISQPLVERAGGTFTEVEHKFFGNSVESRCGTTTDAYAFYCEGDDTIYFSDRVYRDRTYGRLVVADVVIHEYSHHVQAMVGILDASRDLSESQAVTTRRIELQVFCMTYHLFASIPSFDLTVDDHSYFREVWDNTEDAAGHGSVKAQQYWGPRGLAASDLGACNTWEVAAGRVK